MIGTKNTVSIGNQTISYIEHGSGAEVKLFLHGWGGSAESFQPLWHELREQHVSGRFLAIDFPGFGESPIPSSSWDVSKYATCVVQYLDALSIETTNIISHSFGGRVTTKLLAQYPNRFPSAVYIAPAGIRRENTTQKMTKGIVPFVKKCMQFPILKQILTPLRTAVYKLLGSEYIELSGVMKETFQHVVAEDLTPFLGKIHQPVTIIWGRNDSYVPVEDSDVMSEMMPNSTVHIFEDGRHGIHKTHAKQISHIIASV